MKTILPFSLTATLALFFFSLTEVNAQRIMHYGGSFLEDSDWYSMAHISAGYGVQYGGEYGFCVSGKTVSGILGGTLGVGKTFGLKGDNDYGANFYMALNLGYKNFSIEMGGLRSAIATRDSYGTTLYGPQTYFIFLATYNFCIYGPVGLIVGGGLKGSDEFGEEFGFSIGLTLRISEH